MKQTITVQVTGQVQLTFDDQSPEFQQALADYQQCIDPRADRNSMLRQVAHTIIRNGTGQLIEGVGRVGFNGRKPDQLDSGIMVEENYDMFEVEIL